MAATDQPYRSQKALDVVFAVSSVLMLLSIIWMFAEDYNREFKAEQRQFRDVLAAVAQRGALEQLPSLAAFRKAKDAVVQARKQREANGDKINQLRADAARLQSDREKLDAQYQNLKAELDSRRSFYDLAVEEHGAGSDLAQTYMREVASLQKKVEDKLSERDAVVEQIKGYRAQADAQEQGLLNAQAAMNKITEKFDAQVKLAIQKEWRFGDWVRNLPVLDAFAAPVKIEQFTLADLPIDYNFKYVTRYDRCMTCHQGIDKSGFTRERLRGLTEVTPKQEKKLQEARTILAERIQALEGLPEVKNAPDPEQLRLTPVPKEYLTEARVNEFCVHPRLGLFVGPESKHPALKFGCTICHGGQGSATSFALASHTPNGPAEEHRWHSEHGWEHNEFWDFPMLPMRFVESSCLQCHHQVTDLVSSDNRNEAPKLLRGYNLLRENGCFGCHEINGRKNGRDVGPDVRLEPTPPLAALSPAERARALADPDNPPGDMRKVGPSLFRLAEKTNEAWTVRWLRAPRSFRPDTKMPHFYGLSNNNPHKLSDELDGPSQLFTAEDEKVIRELGPLRKKGQLGGEQEKQLAVAERRRAQKDFPDAEIHSIAYFLFENSKDYIRGELRRRDEKQVSDLEGLRAKRVELSSEQKKVLEEARERLEQPAPVTLDQKLTLPAGHTDGAAVARGRKLFSERGCLACHHHEATETPGNGLPAIPGEATFGPSLSQVKAKLGDGKGMDDVRARKWLTQWIMDPHFHSPRSRMPVTHLDADEAADVAAWLLSQEPSELGPDWGKLPVPEPGLDALEKLAKVYLDRNLAPYEVVKYFKGELVERQGGKIRRNERGEPVGRLADLPLEERDLGLKIAEAGGKASVRDLKLFLGKKAVGRLGCFGCHDIPGFEHAKTIGVGLQDWGRKDPARLAFEDSKHFVEDNFYVVDRLADNKGKPFGPKAEKGRRKLPYERFFAEALFHRDRQGYLNLKVRDPRSYDYNGIRAWDDMSRMPQFKFARVRKRKGESDAAFEARRLKEEDEAREAVMTFVLGLVAEPIPGPYVNRPEGDRLREVKGRQVIDRFNCAGCHLIRPGVYDFKLTDKMRASLADAKAGAETTDTADPDLGKYPDLAHNRRWAGATPPPHADSLRAYGANPTVLDDPDQPGKKVLMIVLTEALRYPDPKGAATDSRGNHYTDVRASTKVGLRPEDLVYPPPGVARSEKALAAFGADHQGQLGGTFAELLAGYLEDLDPQEYPRPSNRARASGPPSLIGEGERTQPDWLFKFLLDPQKVRRMAVLRMPRFNLGDDDARALVAYFAGVEHLTNPDVEVTFPHAFIPQQEGLDTAYWRDRTKEYVGRLEEAKLLDKRLEELRPVWEQIRKESEDRAARTGEKAKAAKQAYEQAKARTGKAKAAAAEAAKALEGEKDAAKRPTLEKAKQKADEEAKRAEDEAKEPERVKDSWEGEWERDKELAKGSAVKEQEARWRDREAYLTDAFRLLTNRELCSKCHQIGNLSPGDPKTQGPPLAAVHSRLRPGWARRWVTNPQHYLTYLTIMPPYFPADKPGLYNEVFPGTPQDRVRAVRDALMVYPQAVEMPLNRQWLLPAVAAGPARGDNTREGEKKGDTSKKKGTGK